jgi:hypothetical protein
MIDMKPCKTSATLHVQEWLLATRRLVTGFTVLIERRAPVPAAAR